MMTLGADSRKGPRWWLYSLPMRCFQGPGPRCLAGFLAFAPVAAGLPGRAEEVFTDVTEKAGIRFVHVNGAAGEKHLYETMIGGGGWLDFDGDGNLDLYLVQGHGDSRR